MLDRVEDSRDDSEFAPEELSREDESDKKKLVSHGLARIFIITDKDKAARLIGSGGKTATKLRKQFADTTLKIGKKVPGVNEQVTEVAGPIEQATELLTRIAEIAVEPRSCDEPMLTLLVHNTGGLIGTGGEKITNIRKTSGATIRIADDTLPGSSQTPVTVTGSLDSLGKASRMILEFIRNCKPVERIYSPEMSFDGVWGGNSTYGGWRGDWRERGGRGFGGNGRGTGRRGWGVPEGGWASSRSRNWGSRVEGPRGTKDWGRSLRDAGSAKGRWGTTRSFSDRGSWGNRDEAPGWLTRAKRFPSGNSFHNERGWGKTNDRNSDWGSSRSAGVGGNSAWGGSTKRGSWRGRKDQGF